MLDPAVLLEVYRPAIERGLLFLMVLLLTGLTSRLFLRRLVYAFDPKARHALAGNRIDQSTAVALAATDLIAWFSALLISFEVLGLSALATVAIAVTKYGLLGAATVLVAGFLAYSFSQDGNELILSLIGWRYITYLKRKNEGRGTATLDLDDGYPLAIQTVDAWRTTFKRSDSSTQVWPNAAVMRALLGSRKETRRQTD